VTEAARYGGRSSPVDTVRRWSSAPHGGQAVVDDLIGPEGSHEIELAGVVDPGHVGAESLGELYGERARAAAAPIDQHPAPGRGAVGSVQGDGSRLGDRGGLGEGQLGGLGGEDRCGRDRVVGEAALEGEVVAVDLGTRAEPGDAFAGGVDPPGDDRAERRSRRRAQPAQSGVQRRTA
jgi:hypothetical protein